MAREYNFKKNGKQQNVLKDHDHVTQSPVREQEVPAKNGKQQNVLKDHDHVTQSPVREQEVPAKVDQGL